MRKYLLLPQEYWFLCFIFIIGIFFAGSVRAQTRVQVSTGNTGSSAATSFDVVLSSAPTNGNTLIAVISTRSSNTDNVTSITSTNATWVRAVSSTGNATNGTTTEIWYTSVLTASAGTIVTINQNSARSAAVVLEYSGVWYASALDVYTSNYNTSNSNSATTGTTGATTFANELWIGGIGLKSSSYTLTSPSNSFNSVASAQSTNGTSVNNAKIYALERMVTSTGTASSGGTVSTSSLWSGAVATFFKAVTPAAGATIIQYFKGSGAFTWTAPDCITSITVEAWGGGGGGFTGNSNGGGHGGGGGGYAKGSITNPSGAYNIVVGAGGTAGNNGSASTFASNTIVADYGRGGTDVTTGGGAGGTSNTGNVTTSNGGNGGNGANSGNQDLGGGGGGAGGKDGAGLVGTAGNTVSGRGGTGGAGDNGSGGAGGTGGNSSAGGDGNASTLGGGGGGGGDNGANGGDGGAPGGGGGGGETGGGGGANGQVIITYTLPDNPTIALSTSSTSVCYSSASQNIAFAYSGTTGCPDKYSINFASEISDITDATLSGSPITVSIPAGLAAGTYNGTLTVKNSTYGFVSSGYSISVTVSALPTVTSGTGSSKTYSGTANTTTVSAEASPGATIDWYSNSTGGPALSVGTTTYAPEGVNVGNYTVYAEARDLTSGCKSSSRTAVTLTINKATPNLSVTNSSVTYDGTAKSAAVSGSVAGTVSNILTGGAANQTNAGTYAVTADFVPTDATNYFSLSAASAGNFVINPIAPTLTVSNTPQNYTGSPIAATVNGTGGGTVSNIKYSGSSTVPTNSGTYAITADIAASTNYTAATNVSAGNFVITKIPLTITANNRSKCFGQTISFAGTEFTSSGLVGPDAVTSVTLYSDGAASSATPGNYPITPSVAAGSGLNNYTISYNNGTLTVNALPTIILGTSPSVCKGTTAANLPYSATSGSPNQYSITYDVSAHNAGFSDVTLTSLPATPISLVVPANASVGTYNGTITVKNANGCFSTETPFTVTIQDIDVLVTDALGNSTSCPDFYDFNGNMVGYNAGYSIVKFRVTRSLSNADWNFDYTLTGGTLYSSSPVSSLSGNQTASAGNNFVDMVFYIANTPGSAQTIQFKVTNISDSNCTHNGINKTVSHTISAMPAIGSFN